MRKRATRKRVRASFDRMQRRLQALAGGAAGGGRVNIARRTNAVVMINSGLEGGAASAAAQQTAPIRQGAQASTPSADAAER